ncbi:DUF1643 domain-containing protein [Helicobacter trogontum]|uniref:DUF1643 domain-containing protein n=1 Tax=Helicobacter trogontum TaxID=50960 RepID=UPI000AA647F0
MYGDYPSIATDKQTDPTINKPLKIADHNRIIMLNIILQITTHPDNISSRMQTSWH